MDQPSFDIQEYVELASDKNGARKPQSYTPYPDYGAYNDGGAVLMPEVGAAPQSEFLSENYPSYNAMDRSTDTHHSLELNLSIPSITVQAEEEPRHHEIYSPLYHESPYDAPSPYDHASPLDVPFPNVPCGAAASPHGSPSFADSDWGEDGLQATSPVPNPLNWRMRGETVSEYNTNSNGVWDDDSRSIDQLIEDILEPGQQPNSTQQQQQRSSSQQLFPAMESNSQNLQVPGNQGYYYGSSDNYLSAPSSPLASPTLSPSSPRSPHSGRSSPLPRRPRAYSSPYEVSSDGGASSPGDTGIVTGTRRKTKKNPSLYPCEQCDKKFTRAYNLRSHMRTHTHERPFACSVCGKAFARQHDRKRHEDLHTGEKRYVCNGTLFSSSNWGCGRRFARADALGRHFRTEAGKVCIAPLREDIESKIGQTVQVSEGIIFEGFVDGEPRLVAQAQADDENQTRRAVIISALTEQIVPPL